MEIFHPQGVEYPEVGNIVIAEGEILFDFHFGRGKLHVFDFQFGEFAGDPLAGFCLFQIFPVGSVNAVVNIQPFLGGHEVGMDHADLSHHGDSLCIAAIFFGIDLRTVCLVAGDLPGQRQQVVSGTDAHFHPAVVIEEAVVAVREVDENPHIGEHGNQRLAAFQNIDMLLHVDFKEFGPLHQGDLFHEFHFRELEIRDRIEDGVIHLDFGIGVKAHQGTQFNAAVFIAADIIGQLLFHFHETLYFVKRTERSDLAGIAHFFDQHITLFAVLQQLPGNFDGPLSSGHLEINPGHIQHQILLGPAGTLLTQQGAVIGLTGVEESQPEVNGAQCQIDIKVVDGPILTLGIGVSPVAIAAFHLPAAGCGGIVPLGKIVGDIQLRQHPEEFTGLHFFGDLFFQTEDPQIQIIFLGQKNTFIQRQDLALLQIAVPSLFKMGDSLVDAFFLIFAEIFAAADRSYSQTGTQEKNLFFHLLGSPIILSISIVIFLRFSDCLIQ